MAISFCLGKKPFLEILFLRQSCLDREIFLCFPNIYKMLAAATSHRTNTISSSLKKDNLIKISFEQLSSLQSIYALQILKYIEKWHDLNCWSKVASNGFGYTSFSKLSFATSQNTTPTFQNFVDLKKKEFVLDLQTEADSGFQRKNILLQLAELIWFVYHCKTKIVTILTPYYRLWISTN